MQARMKREGCWQGLGLRPPKQKCFVKKVTFSTQEAAALSILEAGNVGTSITNY